MPVDRGAIDAQLREIGEGDRWWEHPAFRELPHILQAGEQIRGVAEGKLLSSRMPRLRPSGRWLFVATSQRLLCLKQERFARRQVELFPDHIAQARTTRRLRDSQILLETAQGTLRIRIGKTEAYRFTRGLEPLLPRTFLQWLDGPREATEQTIAVVPSPGPGADAGDRLRHLEATVGALQEEVARLRQQVAFLEDLLRRQSDDTLVHGTSPER